MLHVLHKIDASHGMARFYSLSLDVDLFGNTLLIREWGRIGTCGQVKKDLHMSRLLAIVSLNTIFKAKIRKGYIPVHSDLPMLLETTD